MKILISGTGRGGTNLLTELVRKISDLKFTNKVEDRSFFSKKINDNYATKFTTGHPAFTVESIDEKMKNNKNLYVIFSVRNPIDNCLSKILRGQKASDGGDKMGEYISEDGNLNGAVKKIKKLYKIINFLEKKYKERILIIKMEELIENTEGVVSKVSEFLGIEAKDYDGFEKNTRNKYHKKRYSGLENQTDLFKDLNKNFNGFFKNKLGIVEDIDKELSDEIKKYKNFK